MRKKTSNKLSYYAKILIVISITLLVYGIILDFYSDHRLIDPVKDVITSSEEESTISITTSDGSEVIPGNTITTKDSDIPDNTNVEDSSGSVSDTNNSNTSVNNNNNNKSANSNNNNSGNNSNTNNNNSSTPAVPTIEETNNNLRNEIQNTYGVTIQYGSETYGYTVAGVSTTPIENSATINSQLNRLRSALSLYPKGMFEEIRNGGIPLTIILINNYSENSITGVTDSSYSYAKISIAAVYPFEESFFHESYHYIERYLFKRGANFNSWNTLNPSYFSYGTIYNELSYNNTFDASAPFVNNYAQTADTEDRASTFEYMMADSKASCLNYGNTVWQKASYMAKMIESVLSTANPNTTEYWERYL